MRRVPPVRYMTKTLLLSLALLCLFLGTSSGQVLNPWWGGAYDSRLSEGYGHSSYYYGDNTYYTDIPINNFIIYPLYSYFGDMPYSYHHPSPGYYIYYPYYSYYLPGDYSKGRYQTMYSGSSAFPYLQPNWTRTVNYARIASSVRVYDGGSWRTI